MKLVCVLIVFLTHCASLWVACAGDSDSKDYRQHENAAGHHHHKPNQVGSRFIAFETAGKHINLGLDYLLPFLEVPVKRKANGPPKPLVIINSAAILSGGLIAGAGLLVGHLIRSMGLESVDAKDESGENEDGHNARSLFDDEQGFLQLFDNFKLVYRNESGGRVEAALPSFLDTIESTFLEHNINLGVCMLKSICGLVRKASDNVLNGEATELERVLDGAASWSWLLTWLEKTEVREAIDAGRVAQVSNYCTAKYPSCEWAAPEEKLWKLFGTSIQFR
ncbi:uncharacterized protein LOC115621916 [Scaptodrosophila lebanonensis]|uniref:Uncharacterized protein LOC115621916 n=1 Tax=Drosophila lebanonensis TaxID=7225 RepID=A0A6J2T9J4_DROLE|nr:uncharacterized protein LOC115621916 [Scaptodrosophila lebanonensis]